MNRLAIVLGGTEDHIALIEKLQMRGYFVLLIDYYDNPPAKKVADRHIKESILKKEAVLQIAKQEKAEIVIAACIDQALPTMAYVSEKLSLPCHISYSKAIQITNKEQMKIIFSKSEIPTSRFFIFDKANLEDMDNISFPVVIKPLDANSSKGVTKVYEGSKIKDAVECASRVSRSNKIIIEEYALGKEYSADVIIKDKKVHVLMITENIKSKMDSEHFIITQSLFKMEVHRQYELIIKEIAEKIASSFCLDNITLLIQSIINNEGISVIEFSARIGGGSKYHFIKGITGFDVLDFYLHTLFKQNTSDIPKDIIFKYGAINYLYAESCIFSSLHGMDQLKENGIISDYFCYKTEGMCINDHTTSSDRPGGYMILDNNYRLFMEKHAMAHQEAKVSNDQGKNVKVDV